MSRLAAAARLLGVTAVGGALVAGAVVLPSTQLDLTSGPERAAAAPRHALTRGAAASEIACPGPETIGVRGSTASAALPAAAMLTVAVAPADLLGPASAGTLLATPLPAAEHAGFAPVSSTRRLTGSLTRPSAVTVRATGGLAAGLTAEQTTLLTGGDLRGLTSVTCGAPAVDSWLVGGGGEPGRRGRLVLVNPAATPVGVRVDVLSATGPVPSTPGSTLAVPARSRLVLLLDALAPGVQSPVVHVRATGGAVVATLHDARLAGTTPQGTDDVAPAAAPARRVLVPGLTVNGRALLRLAAPGDAEAVGEVRLLGVSGAVDPPGGPAVRVPAGGTLDVDLSDLPAGTYGVEVLTDVPVVAGAMVERSNGAGGPADLAWLASTEPLRAVTGLAVVRSAGAWSTTLELTAPSQAAAIDLVTLAGDGSLATRTLRVPAGSSTLTVLADGEGSWLRALSGSGPVVAARTTTYLNRVGADHGRLITAASLGDLVTTAVDPVVVAAR